MTNDVMSRTPSGRLESDVLWDYRQAVRYERCACGGIVSAGPSERAIQMGVRSHQLTKLHMDWWAQAGWS